MWHFEDQRQYYIVTSFEKNVPKGKTEMLREHSVRNILLYFNISEIFAIIHYMADVILCIYIDLNGVKSVSREFPLH